MPITRQQFEALQPGVATLMRSAGDQDSEKLKAFLTAKQKAVDEGSVGPDGKYIPGTKAAATAAETAANTQAAKDLMADKNTPEGSGVSFGGNGSVGITRGFNPNASTNANAAQANKFLSHATNVYKGINDQLDSSKATLDSLNQGNGTSDKLALINEARLGLAGSGGRAIGQTIALLAGDPTMASDSQKAVNWLQNTPNIPTLQPAQRDAIRESVFARMQQVEQQHQQAANQLMQQGAVVAPSTYAPLVSSFTGPADQKLSELKNMHAQYQAARSKMAQGNPVSNPSVADANPTMLQKFLGGGNASGGMGKFMAPSANAAQGPMRVKHVQSGQVGTIDPSNPKDMQDLQNGVYQQVK